MTKTVRTEWGLECPACKQDDGLMVVVQAWADLSADGTEVIGDHEWDDESFMRCAHCGHSGRVEEFKV